VPFRPIAEKYIAENYHQNRQGGRHKPGSRDTNTDIQTRAAVQAECRPCASQRWGDSCRWSACGWSPACGSKGCLYRRVGDRVVRVSGRGTSDLVFNMFRVENGKLAEQLGTHS